MSVTTDRLLIVQLVNWLNNCSEAIPLPCPILIDDHNRSGKQIWIEPLAGTVVSKRYTSGGYLGAIPFAVYYQETNPKHMAGLDVPLWNLGAFLEEHTPQIPIAQVYAVEMTSTPSGFSRDESKTFVNQAIFNMTYRKGV